MIVVLLWLGQLFSNQFRERAGRERDDCISIPESRGYKINAEKRKILNGPSDENLRERKLIWIGEEFFSFISIGSAGKVARVAFKKSGFKSKGNVTQQQIWLFSFCAKLFWFSENGARTMKDTSVRIISFAKGGNFYALNNLIWAGCLSQACTNSFKSFFCQSSNRDKNMTFESIS